MLALSLSPLAGLLALWLIKWEPVGSPIEDGIVEGNTIPGANPAT